MRLTRYGSFLRRPQSCDQVTWFTLFSHINICIPIQLKLFYFSWNFCSWKYLHPLWHFSLRKIFKLIVRSRNGAKFCTQAMQTNFVRALLLRNQNFGPKSFEYINNSIFLNQLKTVLGADHLHPLISTHYNILSDVSLHTSYSCWNFWFRHRTSKRN